MAAISLSAFGGLPMPKVAQPQVVQKWCRMMCGPKD
jgi:hypothetical protein